MSVSRRQALGSGALAMAATTFGPPAAQADDPPPLPISSAATPSWPVVALNRMGYGPRPGEVEAVQALGLKAYVEQQLNPASINDSACDQRLADARVRITYAAHSQGVYPAVDEVRPLTTLAKSVPELWLLRSGTMDYSERIRPFVEVRVATWIRAVYSKRQLLEVLTDFWHNHFNVQASSATESLCTWPSYDREVIRANCFGNFRTFLQAVGTSASMLYYLDNVSNRAGGGEGGNENYARELLELHTLGSQNYLKFYDDRRNIGTVTYNGKQYARGYIDDDVYEAARCFTGWTLKNGQYPLTALNDGTFHYEGSWHDTYSKTVLSVDGFPNIPRNQSDLKDGFDVYDALAGHPGTARNVCGKLVRRLVSDYAPASIVDAAVAAWMANVSAPDQLKHVVRAILLAPEAMQIWGQKIKRPFDLIVSYMRATGAELLNDDLTLEGNRWIRVTDWFYNEAGHRLFEWPTPTGHPDDANYWTSTNGLLRRWNMPFLMSQTYGGAVNFNLAAQTNFGASCASIVDGWIARLCGWEISAETRSALIEFMAQGGDPNQPPRPLAKAPDWGKPEALADRLSAMVQLLTMSPEFSSK